MKTYRVMAARLFLTALLVPSITHAQSIQTEPDVRAFASSPRWLTTKVYLEGAPDIDVKDKYPGVVGISMWDPDRNRYEFFYTDTGLSKYEHGGGGYFMVTGDRKTHILVPDKGPNRTVVRRLEALNNQAFTYSREVPRDMIETNAPVRIYVVHAPYTGTVQTTPSSAYAQ